jgi:hypothetical protein
LHASSVAAEKLRETVLFEAVVERLVMMMVVVMAGVGV